MSKCIDVVIPTKLITIFPNNKPRVTKGSAEKKKQVHRKVKQAIRQGIKNSFNTKIERRLVSVEGVTDFYLPNGLNRFYTHF